jgi:hypothetical protein
MAKTYDPISILNQIIANAKEEIKEVSFPLEVMALCANISETLTSH